MTTRSRRIGSDWEVRLTRWFREVAKLPAERLHLAGKNDEGDVAVTDVDGGLIYLCEAKAEAKINLSGYMNEVHVEVVNYAKARGLDPESVMPIAVVKRRGYPIEQAYVVTTLADFFRF
jgi:hypothetical protein